MREDLERVAARAALTRAPLKGSRGRPEVRSKRFRGWKVVGAAGVIQGLQSAIILQALGSYLVALERDFGWSKSTLAAAYSMNRAESAVLGPIQGWALDRYGPKRVARIGSVVLALGFLGFSQVQELWQFFAVFVFVSVGAGFCGFLTVTVAVVRWFERRRARALALGSMGFALGGACVPLVVLLIERFGWRWTAAGTGVGAAIALWFLAAVLDGRPEDHGQEVDGGAPASDERSKPAEGLATVHFTAAEAVRTRAFWMISLGHMSALLAVGAVLAHLQLYLVSERDFTLTQASLVAGALPIMQLAGMVLGGMLGDRVNKRLIASAAMGGHATGLLLLAWSASPLAIGLFVLLHGMAWGARGPMMQALRADYFGSSSFGAIMGMSSMIVMLGTVLGPLIAGVFADGFGYQWGFMVVASLTGMGMVFFVLATPPAAPLRPAVVDRPAATEAAA